MKIKDITAKSDDALKTELTDRRKHLFDLRSQAVTEKLEDPTQLGKTRKDIARIKTVIRQRQLDKQPKKPKGTKRSDRPRAVKPTKRPTKKK